MFEQTFVGGGQTKKPFTVLLAFALQIVLIVVAVIIAFYLMRRRHVSEEVVDALERDRLRSKGPGLGARD